MGIKFSGKGDFVFGNFGSFVPLRSFEARTSPFDDPFVIVGRPVAIPVGGMNGEGAVTGGGDGSLGGLEAATVGGVIEGADGTGVAGTATVPTGAINAEGAAVRGVVGTTGETYGEGADVLGEVGGPGPTCCAWI